MDAGQLIGIVIVIVVVVIMAGCLLSNMFYREAQKQYGSQLIEHEPKQRTPKHVGTQSRSDEALNWGAH